VFLPSREKVENKPKREIQPRSVEASGIIAWEAGFYSFLDGSVNK
jgi:hypothetical protein